MCSSDLVIGRKVEDAFFSYIVTLLKKKGVDKLSFEFIPGKRNHLCKDLGSRWGLKEVSEDQYEGSIEKLVNIASPSFISIETLAHI
mgnify:CR=1 FL=1